MEKLIENKYAKLSLISVTLTMLIATVHHIYELGARPVILVPLFGMVLLPSVLMLWFKQTRHNGAGTTFSIEFPCPCEASALLAP